MLRAVLFDFSDTLFPAYGERQIKELLLDADPDVSVSRIEAISTATRLQSSSPEELAKGRDLSADAHRRCWTDILRPFDYFGAGTAERIYTDKSNPSRWVPFPDTAAVLTDLHASGVPIGVVSDIGWDLRPVFERHGLYPLVGSWVLSFEHGIEKPDPRLFHRCCAELEVEPNEAIMIGDSVERDGGAANAGLTALVLPRYPGRGERGLRAAIHLLS